MRALLYSHVSMILSFVWFPNFSLFSTKPYPEPLTPSGWRPQRYLREAAPPPP